jgi:dihydrofolate reductase
MRTVTYGAACSLDMFITGPDGGVEWLLWSDDVQAIMANFWGGVDAVLTGRKTYEFALKSGGGGGSMPGVTGYVCSHTLPDTLADGATVVHDAVAFVRELKAQGGKGICLMGGGELAKSLFAAGLIDEVSVNIHPVLLGAGIPMFPGPVRRTDLELLNCRALKGGCVLANYRVKRDS